MKTLPLSRGMVAIVDDADFESVSQFKWYAFKSRRVFYAARNVKRADGSKGIQFMHNFLIPSAEQVDHCDGDGLNNRRFNIRPCTHQQNRMGRQRKAAGKTSRYRGVRLHEGRWQARIQIDRRQITLGRFPDERDAALAYDRAARELFGDFAAPNFP